MGRLRESIKLKVKRMPWYHSSRYGSEERSWCNLLMRLRVLDSQFILYEIADAHAFESAELKSDSNDQMIGITFIPGGDEKPWIHTYRFTARNESDPSRQPVEMIKFVYEVLEELVERGLAERFPGSSVTRYSIESNKAGRAIAGYLSENVHGQYRYMVGYRATRKLDRFIQLAYRTDDEVLNDRSMNQSFASVGVAILALLVSALTMCKRETPIPVQVSLRDTIVVLREDRQLLQKPSSSDLLIGGDPRSRTLDRDSVPDK